MHGRFVLGAAGTGKTLLCVEEIRRALRKERDGPPPLLLVPKQATFQLERQLLADGAVAGYTRLTIASFERLAQAALRATGEAAAPLISEDGRTMALQALLWRRREQLHVFRSSVSLPGFARQLSQELRDLQQRRITPGALREVAGQGGLAASLRGKLLDLALLLEDYQAWLENILAGRRPSA